MRMVFKTVKRTIAEPMLPPSPTDDDLLKQSTDKGINTSNVSFKNLWAVCFKIRVKGVGVSIFRYLKSIKGTDRENIKITRPKTTKKKTRENFNMAFFFERVRANIAKRILKTIRPTFISSAKVCFRMSTRFLRDINPNKRQRTDREIKITGKISFNFKSFSFNATDNFAAIKRVTAVKARFKRALIISTPKFLLYPKVNAPFPKTVRAARQI